MPTGTRFCSKCETEKPVSEFKQVKSDKITKRKLTCTKCLHARNAANKKAQQNADPVARNAYLEAEKKRYRKNALEKRDYWLRNRYGVTLEQYNFMLDEQDGVCGLCSQPEVVKGANGELRNLAVDHDHACCPGTKSCGRCIRGLLCFKCNTSMSLLDRMSPKIIEIYLNCYRAERLMQP